MQDYLLTVRIPGHHELDKAWEVLIDALDQFTASNDPSGKYTVKVDKTEEAVIRYEDSAVCQECCSLYRYATDELGCEVELIGGSLHYFAYENPHARMSTCSVLPSLQFWPLDTQQPVDYVAPRLVRARNVSCYAAAKETLASFDYFIAMYNIAFACHTSCQARPWAQGVLDVAAKLGLVTLWDKVTHSSERLVSPILPGQRSYVARELISTTNPIWDLKERYYIDNHKLKTDYYLNLEKIHNDGKLEDRWIWSDYSIRQIDRLICGNQDDWLAVVKCRSCTE